MLPQAVLWYSIGDKRRLLCGKRPRRRGSVKAGRGCYTKPRVGIISCWRDRSAFPKCRSAILVARPARPISCDRSLPWRSGLDLLRCALPVALRLFCVRCGAVVCAPRSLQRRALPALPPPPSLVAERSATLQQGPAPDPAPLAVASRDSTLDRRHSIQGIDTFHIFSSLAPFRGSGRESATF